MQIFFIMLALIPLSETNVFAYIDPNTGGYVFQILVQIFAAIGAAYVFFKNQIKRAATRIRLLFKKPES